MIDRSKQLPVSDIPNLTAPDLNSINLKNGVKVHILNSGTEQVCRITISWYNGRFEAIDQAAASLMADLLKVSSPTLSAEEMSDLLDSNGAWVVTELHDHFLTLNVFAVNAKLGTLLPELVEIINQPKFPTDELETGKARKAAQRELMDKKVSFVATIHEGRRLFGQSHPAANDVTAKEILDVTAESLYDLYEQNYKGSAPTVYIAGRIDCKTQELIVSCLEHINIVTETKSDKIRIEPFSSSEPGYEFSECKDSLQSAVLISIPALLRSHPDYDKLRIVTIALGGYFGSRLMTVIREEKGLTYGISAALIGRREGSFVTISSQCDPTYTSAVVDETLKEIHRLATVPMNDEELTTLKRYIKSTLAASFDTPFTAMDYYITMRHIGTPTDYLERQQKALDEMTPEIIMDIASQYIDNAPKYITVAGPASAKK